MFFRFGGDFMCLFTVGEFTFSFIFRGLILFNLLFFDLLEPIDVDLTWELGVPNTPCVFLVFFVKQKNNSSV